jgi:hypothetical protein
MGRYSGVCASMVVGVLTVVAIAEATPTPVSAKGVVRRFYAWTLDNGQRVRRLEPKVSWDPATRELALGTATLPDFVGAFMDSGLFAPEFAGVLAGYYQNHAAAIAATPPDLLEAYAMHGRDILLETEDMDIFFCAQESEYTPSFIRQMKLIATRATPEAVTIRSISTYEWKTDFTLRKLGDQWLITGYCVFH